MRTRLLIFPTLFLLCVSIGIPLDGQTGRAARYQPGDWVNYSNFHYITSFEEGSDFVYIGTTHGVLRFNKTTGRYDYPYTVSSGLQNGYVLNMLYLDNSDELWVFTKGGVDVIYTVLDRWYHIDGTDLLLQQASRGVQVGFSSGSVWLVLNRSVYHEFDQYGRFHLGRGNPENQQVHWKGREPVTGDIPQYYLGRGWDINRINNTLENDNFREYQFTVRYRDTQNREWIGTWGGGYLLADPVTKQADLHRFGPISNAVGALYQVRDGFWFGSAGSWYAGPPSIEGEHGISHWNSGGNYWWHFASAEEYDIEKASVYAIAGDEQCVWFGTDRGLLSYRPGKDQWYRADNPSLANNQVYDVEVTDTTLWVAGRTGLYNLAHPAGYVRNRIPLLQDRFLSAYDITLRGDSVYVGTDQGLAGVHRHTGEVSYYSDDGKAIPVEKFH